jgi:uncharacterized membrane protein YfcA
MSVLSFLPYHVYTVVALLAILALSAVVSGLSGFGFSAIGAVSLWILPPQEGIPLLMALSSANQLLSLKQLRRELKPWREWWPNGPLPFIVGGLFGIPIGLVILHGVPTPFLLVAFGFLVSYAAYASVCVSAMRRPSAGWCTSTLIGGVGGMIGGFTACPSAAVVMWIGKQGMSKCESRAIVQPYVFAMQILALFVLAITQPATFDARFWHLFVVSAPLVLFGTLVGLRLYHSISDINFRRVCFMLLSLSGLAILGKGLDTWGLDNLVHHLAL